MVTTDARQTFKFNYSNVGTVNLLLTKTDLDGTTHTFTLVTYDAGYATGDKTYEIKLHNNITPILLVNANTNIFVLE